PSSPSTRTLCQAQDGPTLLLCRDFYFAALRTDIVPFLLLLLFSFGQPNSTTPSDKNKNNPHFDLEPTLRVAQDGGKLQATHHTSRVRPSLVSSMDHLLTRCVHRELGSSTVFFALLPTEHQAIFGTGGTYNL